MAGEEYTGVTKGAELGSQEDVELEQRLKSLDNKTGQIALCVGQAKKNAFFKTIAEGHYREGLELVQQILGMPNVIYSEETASLAGRENGSIDHFLTVCEKVDWLPSEEDLRPIFQSLVEVFLSPEEIAKQGEPCNTYRKILSRYATVPEDATPKVQTLPPKRETLYEKTFPYGSGAHMPYMGEFFVRYLMAKQNLSESEAKKRFKVQELQEFVDIVEFELQKRFGEEECVVQAAIVREPDGEIKKEFRRFRG